MTQKDWRTRLASLQQYRFGISSFVAVSAFALSTVTLAQHTVSPSTWEMAAIYEHFGVTPDDPKVFEIKGRAITAAEYPRHLTAILTTPPYLFEDSMCVLETTTHWGEVIDSEIAWADSEPEKSLRIWLTDDPSNCSSIDADKLPNTIYVRTDSIGQDVLLQILRLEDEILSRAASEVEGSGYPRDDYRMTNISPARKDLAKDLGDFCTTYRAPNALRGPSICIEFEGQNLVIKSASYWIS